jgi:hypothetical protein
VNSAGVPADSSGVAATNLFRKPGTETIWETNTQEEIMASVYGTNGSDVIDEQDGVTMAATPSTTAPATM